MLITNSYWLQYAGADLFESLLLIGTVSQIITFFWSIQPLIGRSFDSLSAVYTSQRC